MTPRDRIIVTAGDFDPPNLESMRFLQQCKSRGDWLIVGLHSDMLIHLKKGSVFNNFNDRFEMLDSFKFVDEVFNFNDGDGTVCNLLKVVKLCYPQAVITFISDSDMTDRPEKRIRGINFEVIK
jgi:glycerol-3-phosphate cytidylyltransferase-like family protein